MTADTVRDPSGGWSWPSDGIPREAWLLGTLGVVALAVGAIAHGFYGTEWYWDAQLLVRALPGALPMLVAAGVLAGAFRWPASGRWLVAAATLLAIHGVLTVAGDTWIALWSNWVATTPTDVEQGLMIAAAQLAQLALIGGVGALAMGLWRARRHGPMAGWGRAALGAAAIAAAMAFGGVARYVATASESLAVVPPLEMVYWLLLTLVAASGTALATAAILAIPDRHRLPEIAIAVGAMLWVALTGGLHWSIATPTGEMPMDMVLIFARGAVIGLIVLAAGFAAARLFPARPG